MSLYYDRDDRTHDPNADNRRRGNFKAGWNDFVAGKHMTQRLLEEKLTFENLGYRLAATYNAAFEWKDSNGLVDRAYELAVEIQATNLKMRDGAPGNRPQSE